MANNINYTLLSFFAASRDMPETSIDKNHHPILPEYNIRFARKPSEIYTIPEPIPKQKPPDKHLRFCILALYHGHVV